MSLYERVPEIELSPEYGARPLQAMQPRDYLHLLHDLLYFPQRVRDYIPTVAHNEQGESRAPRAAQGEAWRGWAANSPVQIEFIFMLGVVCVLAVGAVVSAAGFLSAWLAQTPIPFDGITFAMVIGIGVSLGLLVLGVLFNAEGYVVVLGLPMGMAIGLFLLAFDVAPRYGLDAGFVSLLLLAGLCGIAFGIAASGFFATTSFGWNNVTTQTILAAGIGFVIAIAVGYFGWSDSIVNAPNSTETLSTALTEIILIGLAAALFFLLAALRVDDYLLHGRYPGQNPSADDWSRIPRVTSIHINSLHDHITAWLDHDWKRGMDNIASLWRYTAQQETIRRALHEVLSGAPVGNSGIGARPARRTGTRAAPVERAETPIQQAAAKAAARQTERQFELIGHIADHPSAYPWDMVTYDNPARSAIVWSAGRHNTRMPATAANTYVQRRMKRQQIRQRALSRGPAINLPNKTTEQALTAGFWYLDRGYIADAAAAFRKAPDTPFIKEMQSIVDALDVLSSEENLLANPALKLPRRPDKPRRPETWAALDKVQQTVRFARVARQSTQKSKRDQAAEQARRLLNELGANRNATRVELRHIRRLADLWQADLEEWLSQSGAQSGGREALRPVDNPFLYAEPLRKGQMFVDRDVELNELRLAWSSDNLQPVVVFGQPLVGKTSLLYAARNANQHVELAWFHLGHSNRDRASIPQMLAAICSAVQQATILDVFSLGGARNTVAPNIERANDPYADTERFIRHACTLLAPRNLILVMDDFDTVQQLFTTQNDLHHFLDFLEHLFQTIKNFNVVFVSQYAPVFFEETARHSFAGSARMHHVGPLQRKHIAALLRPAEFPLYFTDEAVDEVMRLSGGHPYLAQLLAHSVVRTYNRLVTENKPENHPEPLIEYDDIRAVLDEPEVEQRSQILFMRMDALARRVGNRADSLLDAIAIAPQGLPRTDLLARLNSTGVRDERTLDTALYRLKRYGMIEEDSEGKWRVRNELWRQWEETRTPRALLDNRLDTLPDTPAEPDEEPDNAPAAVSEIESVVSAPARAEEPVMEQFEEEAPGRVVPTPNLADDTEDDVDENPEAHPAATPDITEDAPTVFGEEPVRDEEIVAFSDEEAQPATTPEQSTRITTLDPADGHFDDFVEGPQAGGTPAAGASATEPVAAPEGTSAPGVIANFVPPQRIQPDRAVYAPRSTPVLPDAALKDLDPE